MTQKGPEVSIIVKNLPREILQENNMAWSRMKCCEFGIPVHTSPASPCHQCNSKQQKSQPSKYIINEKMAILKSKYKSENLLNVYKD